MLVYDKVASIIDLFRSSAVIQCLEKEDVSRVEKIVITHSDIDHIGSLAVFLQNYESGVNQVLLNLDAGMVGNGRIRSILQVLVEMQESGRVQVSRIDPGVKWERKGVVCTCLYPEHSDLLDAIRRRKTNDASAILRIDVYGWTFLIAGDAGTQVWSALVRRGCDIRADVLKFPHHGAWFEASGGGVDPTELMHLVSPSLVVISAGMGNPYGHPSERTLSMLKGFEDVMIAVTELGSERRAEIKTDQLACEPGDSILVEVTNESAKVGRYSSEAPGNPLVKRSTSS